MILQNKQKLNERKDELISLLKEKKQLSVLEGQEFKDLGFVDSINVKDSNNSEYSLLVYDSNNLEVLRMAQKHSNLLKTLDHPNVVKCYSDFFISDYYFVQIEAIPWTLLNWIHRNEQQQQLDQMMFLDIALQMMEATFYLNNNKCHLYLRQTLSCFMIDGENKIKIFFFNPFPEKVNPLVLQQLFSACVENEELFYYPEYLLKIKKPNLIYHDPLFDVCALGVCLYHLIGVSCDRVLKFIKGQEGYTYQSQLSFESNCILYALTFLFFNWYQRPSLSLFKEQLSMQKNQLHQKQGMRDNIEEIADNSQILEDFSLFQKSYICFYQKDEMGAGLLLEPFQSLVEKYQHFDLMYFILAKLQSENDEQDNSRESFLKTIELNPKYDGAIVQLAIMSNNNQEVKELYLQALEANPNYEYALENLGDAYKSSGLYEEAIKYYRKIIEISPHFGSSLYNLGTIYFYQDKTQDAMQCLIEDIELNDDQSYACYQLDLIYSNDLKVEDAQDYLENLAEDNPIALHQLGKLNMTKRETKNALKYYKKALQLNYQNDNFIKDFASFYEKQSLNQNAICLLKLFSKKHKKVFKKMDHDYRNLKNYDKSIECAKIYHQQNNSHNSLFNLNQSKIYI